MRATDWPPDLRDYLADTLGGPVRVEHLSGAGGPGACRVSAPRGTLIVKNDPDGREVRFYQRVAPNLRQRGLAIPELLWSDQHWLAMEAIPHPLPRSRWAGDPDVLATLARLHSSPPTFELDGLPLFRPQWTVAMTDAALGYVPAGERGLVQSKLHAIRERAGELFQQRRLISGDPNPTNWGLRSDGAVVLFDWERFGLGAPAIDVAISMPGLPSPNGGQEERVASRYLEFWAATGGEPPATVRQFAAEIRRAKLWTIVEFLEAHASGELPAEAGETATMLAAWLPQGVRSID
jgi:hypothetical protein